MTTFAALRTAHSVATALVLLALSPAAVANEPLANIVKVSAGFKHSCVLTATGGVRCWGGNAVGQLGNNSTTTLDAPADVSGLTSGVSAISVGEVQTCVVTTSGGAKCWGYNANGELGDGTGVGSLVPVNVSGLTSGVASIAVGANHTCAVTTGGGAKCWGNNNAGQLGNGNNSSAWVPGDVSGLASGVAAVATGTQHSCALTSVGGVKCWGLNEYGQLGDGSTANSAVPVSVSGLASGVAAIAAGATHTCALMTGGSVKCWGQNNLGMLGDGSDTNSAVPVSVIGLGSGAAAISMGGAHSCALTTGGGVKCWGYNANGELGDGTGTSSLIPVDVSGLTSGVSAISGGTNHTCAVTGGGAMCWGYNDAGQLGNGNAGAGSLVPVTVVLVKHATTLSLQANPGASTIGQAVTFTVTASGSAGVPTGSVTFRDGGVDITDCLALPLVSGNAGCTTSAMAVGSHSVTAVYSGDAANDVATSAPLAISIFLTRLPPTLDLQANPNPSPLGTGVTFTLTASGPNGTPTGSVTFQDGGVDIGGCVAVALASGSAECTTSALAVGDRSITAAYSGDGAYISATSEPLTQVIGNPILAAAKSGIGSGTITSIPAGIDCGATCAASFAVGSSVTLLAAPASGSTAFWLGCPSPAGNECTVVMGAPITVTAKFDVAVATTSISAGGYSIGGHTCARTAPGGLKCWGRNVDGELGNGAAPTPSVTPVDVSGLSSGVAAVSAGTSHTCAVTTGGAAKCWGSNSFGQLGTSTGNPGSRATPVDVFQLSAGVSAITTGSGHTCAIFFGGAHCWGANNTGQMGTGTIGNRDSHLAVVGLSSGVAAISAAGTHTCALTTAGGVKCWGDNSNGQVGDGGTVNRFTPADVIGLTSGVAAIAAGGSHSCALTTGGGVKCWGSNFYGTLGDGSGIESHVPVDVPGLASGVLAIAAGGSHTCALTTSGGAKCWGFNDNGALGDGTTTTRFTPVDVVGLASGVVAIAAGGYHTCAITTSGGVRCWGNNLAGELGDNSTTQRLVPVDVAGGLGPAVIPTYLLTVTLAGTGSGVVTSTGIACPGDCSETHFSGEVVTLLATPNGGSAFGGWSGGGCSGTGGCTVAMDQALNVTATFVPSYLLSVSKPGNGTGTVASTTPPGAINCGSTCAASFIDGTSVTLAATPGINATFTGWSGACSGTGSCVVTMDQARNVTATFTLNTYPLSVTKAGGGSGTIASSAPAGAIDCGSTCSASFSHGTSVTLVATASIGSTFTGWSGACTGGTCVVTMDQARNVTATFALNTYALAVTKSGAGSGTVASTPGTINCGSTCSASFAYGTSVTLTATASAGSTFAGWSGSGCSGTGTCQVTVTAGVTVSANFQLVVYVVTPSAGTHGTISPDTAQSVSHGTSTTFTVTADSGYAGSVGGTCAGILYAASGFGPQFFTAGITSDCTVTASFAPAIASTYSAGDEFGCVVTAGGAVRCWGSNGQHQMGAADTLSRFASVPVSGLASDVVTISAGGSHACAMTTSGGVKCWGYNANGELGDGTTSLRFTPAFVSGLESGVAALEAGASHTCALTTGGGVRCWGWNNHGNLGDGSTTTRNAPVDVSGLTGGIKAISAGLSHTCALTTGGGVKCWGYNNEGQLGDGSETERLTPVDVAGLASGVAAISAGQNHTCALTTAGGVKCWGDNPFGQLGDDSVDRRLTPINVSGLSSGNIAVMAGYQHSCAITASGGVKCWGYNGSGRLGDGTAVERHTPVDVTGLTSGVAAISSGLYHTCALSTGGRLKCWGYNAGGQLGDNSEDTRVEPVGVYGFGHEFGVNAHSISFAPPESMAVAASIPLSATATSGLAVTFTTWTPGTCSVSGAPPAQVLTPTAVGLCGVIASQSGDASYLPAPQQLRLLSITVGPTSTVLTGPASSTPGQAVQFAAAVTGATSTGTVAFKDGVATISGCAAVPLSAGQAQCTTSALALGPHTITAEFSGDANVGPSTSPPLAHTVAVSTFTLSVARNGTGGGTVTGPGISCPGDCSEVVTVGTIVTLNALAGVGSIFSGWSGGGCSGTGSCEVTVSADVTVTATFTLITFNVTPSAGPHGTISPDTVQLVVPGATPVFTVTPEPGFLMSIGGTCGGTLVGTTYTTAPVASHCTVTVSFSSLVASMYSGGDEFSCAVTTEGAARCWGGNTEFQLGTIDNAPRTTSVPVSGLASDVVTISAGGSHACAMTTSGGVKCWGFNANGELGDGTTNSRSTPAFVSGLQSGVAALEAGTNHNCVITTDGGVKCWGYNNNGNLGDGTTAPRLMPVNVSGLASGVKAITAGWNHTCALTTGGGVKCWGYNNEGQVGDGTEVNRLTPTDVTGLTSGVAAISAGQNHTCVLTTAGGVKCWGDNPFGQLGDNTIVRRATPVDVSGLSSGNIAVMASFQHSCAITASGGVKCWGYNGNGRLGDGTAIESHTPVDVSGLTSGVAAIASGLYHTCARSTGGGLKCWGYNASGQLGDDTVDTRNTPVAVAGFGAGFATGAQSIGFAPPAAIGFNAPTPLSAGATSGLAVTFATWTPDTCTISGAPSAQILTPTALGLCGVIASQAGDSNYFPAPRELRLISITLGATSITLTGPATSVQGQSVNFLATVTGATNTGAVTFKDGSSAIPGCETVTIAGGQAACATSTLGLGPHTITAEYSGTATLDPSTSAPLVHTVVVPNFTLSVTRIGTGSGSVSGTGINCPGDCSEVVPAGAVVTLHATANDGSTFTGWSDSNCPGTADCQVTVTADMTVVATFALIYRTVDVSLDGFGTVTGSVGVTPVINCPGDCSEIVPDGTVVTFTAVPSAGSTFAGWGGACSGTGPCAVTANADVVVSATFATVTHTLSVEIAGSGSGSVTGGVGGLGIDCPGVCFDVLNAGSHVTLVASAPEHSTFTGWGGNVCSGTGSCAFTINADATVIANFEVVNFIASTYSAGESFGCVVTTSGGVRCWGNNSTAQLGNLDTSLVSVPVTDLASGVATLSAGARHACALTTGGGVKCWGSNSNGQLGVGPSPAQTTPISVAGLTSAVAAVEAGGSHTCAITTGGAVKCWGRNSSGELGDGTVTPRVGPVDVSGLASGVNAISAGGGHTCVLTAAGGVKCWGSNFFGQLGDQSTTSRSAPVDVLGLGSGVAAISAGNNHTCALTAGGAVKCWGRNVDGQLGDNTTTTRSAPADVAGMSSGSMAVVAGDRHSCAITQSGGVKCWGFNGTGALGNGTAIDSNIPVNVTGLASGVSTISLGDLHTCALSAGGGVACWGNNADGRLGDNTIVTRTQPVAVFGFGAGFGATAQSIAFTPPASIGSSASIPLSATATSGLAVTFSTWTPGTCSVSGIPPAQQFLVPATSGLCGIIASQGGDATHLAAPQQLRLISIAGVATSVVLTGPASAPMGQLAQFIATVTGATSTGTVAFKDGSTAIFNCEAVPLSAGQAQCATSILSLGPHSITATYSGAAGIDPSTSASFAHLVVVPTYTLTVTTSGGGTGTVTGTGINCPGDCTEAFDSASNVSLTATAAAGSTFAGWSGDCSGTSACVVTMFGTRNVTATFSLAPPNTFALTVARAGTGSGTVASAPAGTIDCGTTCTANVTSGNAVTLVATPATGSTFAGWSGACSGTGNCTVTMDAAKSVTATFSQNTYTVTASASANGTITPPSRSVGHGATTTFTVTPNASYDAAVGGTCGGALVGTTYTTNAITADCTVIAIFTLVNPPRLGNISTRMQVLTGNDVMIGGFVIGGSTTKRVAIVATGPSLVPFGITNALANPTLRLVRSSDQATLATSDDWQAAANSAQLTAAGFAPSNPLEAAILIDLPPGAYTAIVEGAGGATGVAVIGVYEVDHPETPLVNISTRGRVLTGNDVMIGGFIVNGTGPQTVAIVATGPSLAAFGITSPLANPTISLVRSSDQAVIATNDDWQTDASAAQLQAAGFAPTSTLESGLYRTLPPGAYTVIVQGVAGGTGVAVIGVYKVN